MADEIQIIINELRSLEQPNQKIVAVFDVWHTVDAIRMAAGEEAQGKESQLFDRIDRSALKVYREYEDRRDLMNLALPHERLIDGE